MHSARPELHPHRAAHRRAPSWLRRVMTSLVLPLTVVGLVTSAMYGAGRLAEHLAQPDQSTTPARIAAVAWMERTAELVSGWRPPSPASTEQTREGAESGAEGRWARALRELDQRRAGAWRLGRADQLAAVYVPTSHALTRDQAMLGAYAARGLRVDGASLSFMRVRLIRRDGRTVTLRTVDQLQRAVARRDDGQRVALPRDRPSRHVIVLERSPAGWRVAAVTAL